MGGDVGAGGGGVWRAKVDGEGGNDGLEMGKGFGSLPHISELKTQDRLEPR